MFQLTSGIAFGVDVADFFQLQRAFHGDGVMHATAQEQGVFLAGKTISPCHDLRLQSQHSRDSSRQVAQGFQVVAFLLLIQVTFDLSQCDGQQEQGGQLGGEGFSGSHANFHASTGDVGQLALAHHGAGGHVADGQGLFHAQAAGMFQGGQSIGGFAGLGNRHHQSARVGHAVAVAVLAGNFHVDGDLGQRLDPVAGGQPGVVAGAASQDQHIVDVLKNLVGLVAKQFRRNTFNVLQGIAHSARLLEDFLLHKVTVWAQFSRCSMQMHGVYRTINGAAVLVHDPHFIDLQIDHITVFQIDDLIGRAGQCQGIRCQEVFVLAHAHHQGRTMASTDHTVRLVLTEHGNGVSARQATDDLLHGLEQITVVQVVDQVSDHFGIGLALEHVANALQLGAQFVVVFDDAVMHQRNTCFALAGEMRVSIVSSRRAVRCPAGVSNAGKALQMICLDLFLQLGHALSTACPQQLALRMNSNAARIVAPVLQTLQTFQQHGNNIALRHSANNSTHSQLLFMAPLGGPANQFNPLILI